MSIACLECQTYAHILSSLRTGTKVVVHHACDNCLGTAYFGSCNHNEKIAALWEVHKQSCDAYKTGEKLRDNLKGQINGLKKEMEGLQSKLAGIESQMENNFGGPSG